MERTKLLFTLLFVVAAFAIVFLSVRPATVADASGPDLIPVAVAPKAVDFTLPLASTGQTVTLLTAAKAQPVVLDFWATWCGPCRDELPHLETLSQKYKGRVAFYGVNSSDAPKSIVAFSREYGITFPTLSDSRHKAAAAYGADAIPLLVVIDTHGKVRFGMQGYDPHVEAELSKTLDAVLAGK